MTGRLRRVAGALLLLALAGTLVACGGFGSAPPPPDQSIRSYVALGDGFTAGPYTGRTTAEDGCLRSDRNYPAQVAEQLHITDVRDVSCTGATTRAFTEGFRPAGGTKVAAQLAAVRKDTGLVTIGGGIEDGNTLTNMFRACLVEPCPSGTVYYAKVVAAVNRAVTSLTDALRTIQAKAPGAYIVVVGYPRLTPPPDQGCAAFPTLTGQPQDVANYLLDYLNDKLRSAARQTGSGFVDVAALSGKHVLCSRKPWVHGVDAQAGTAVAFHPVAAEQDAVAAATVTAVKQR